MPNLKTVDIVELVNGPATQVCQCAIGAALLRIAISDARLPSLEYLASSAPLWFPNLGSAIATRTEPDMALIDCLTRLLIGTTDITETPPLPALP